jgi:hypothetical protein
MGLPTYNCTEELAQRVPDVLSPIGVHVVPRPRPRCRHSYTLRRGLGTVQFGGFVEKEGDPYTFFLTCGSNPLLWLFDMRLLSRVEKILLSHGASHWTPDEEPAA